MKTQSAWPWIALIACVYMLAAAAQTIFLSIERMKEIETTECTKSSGWRPRTIPKCDKELWLRITEGCQRELDT